MSDGWRSPQPIGQDEFGYIYAEVDEQWYANRLRASKFAEYRTAEGWLRYTLHVSQRDDGAWDALVYRPEISPIVGEIGIHVFSGIAATEGRARALCHVAAASQGRLEEQQRTG